MASGQGGSIVPARMRQLVLDGASDHDLADARPVVPPAVVRDVVAVARHVVS